VHLGEWALIAAAEAADPAYLLPEDITGVRGLLDQAVPGLLLSCQRFSSLLAGECWLHAHWLYAASI
jgi:hypothetical protein